MSYSDFGMNIVGFDLYCCNSGREKKEYIDNELEEFLVELFTDELRVEVESELPDLLKWYVEYKKNYIKKG